jgi:hypothetical protein
MFVGIDEKLPVESVNFPGFQGDGAGRRGRLARADVETALVERAFDLGTHDESFSQRPGTVRALILGGEKPSIQAENRVCLPVELDPDRHVRLYSGGGTQRDEPDVGNVSVGRHVSIPLFPFPPAADPVFLYTECFSFILNVL